MNLLFFFFSMLFEKLSITCRNIDSGFSSYSRCTTKELDGREKNSWVAQMISAKKNISGAPSFESSLLASPLSSSPCSPKSDHAEIWKVLYSAFKAGESSLQQKFYLLQLFVRNWLSILSADQCNHFDQVNSGKGVSNDKVFTPKIVFGKHLYSGCNPTFADVVQGKKDFSCCGRSGDLKDSMGEKPLGDGLSKPVVVPSLLSDDSNQQSYSYEDSSVSLRSFLCSLFFLQNSFRDLFEVENGGNQSRVIEELEKLNSYLEVDNSENLDPALKTSIFEQLDIICSHLAEKVFFTNTIDKLLQRELLNDKTERASTNSQCALNTGNCRKEVDLTASALEKNGAKAKVPSVGSCCSDCGASTIANSNEDAIQQGIHSDTDAAPAICVIQKENGSSSKENAISHSFPRSSSGPLNIEAVPYKPSNSLCGKALSGYNFARQNVFSPTSDVYSKESGSLPTPQSCCHFEPEGRTCQKRGEEVGSSFGVSSHVNCSENVSFDKIGNSGVDTDPLAVSGSLRQTDVVGKHHETPLRGAGGKTYHLESKEAMMRRRCAAPSMFYSAVMSSQYSSGSSNRHRRSNGIGCSTNLSPGELKGRYHQRCRLGSVVEFQECSQSDSHPIDLSVESLGKGDSNFLPNSLYTPPLTNASIAQQELNRQTTGEILGFPVTPVEDEVSAPPTDLNDSGSSVNRVSYSKLGAAAYSIEHSKHLQGSCTQVRSTPYSHQVSPQLRSMPETIPGMNLFGQSNLASSSLSSTSSRSPVWAANACPYEYILVLDFEATCVEHPDPSYVYEIIEFPVVLVDTRLLRPMAEFHSYVRPREKPVLSEFCKRLTGIAQEMVDNAPPLEEVLRQFDRWCMNTLPQGASSIFATDGCSDLQGFMYTHAVTNLGYLFPESFYHWIDVKRVFSAFFNCPPGKIKCMLDVLHRPFEGRLHSGIDDARNIASIVIGLLQWGSCLNEVPVCHVNRRASPSQLAPYQYGATGTFPVDSPIGNAEYSYQHSLSSSEDMRLDVSEQCEERYISNEKCKGMSDEEYLVKNGKIWQNEAKDCDTSVFTPSSSSAKISPRSIFADHPPSPFSIGPPRLPLKQ